MRARRLEVRLGLAAAPLFALVWWVAFLMMAVPDSVDLGVWAVRGASAWGAWMIYRFFWAHSRALGNRGSGARSSALTNLLLYFCLPVPAFFLADGGSWFITVGDPWPSAWDFVVYGSLVGVLPGLLWAVGRVSLVSTRERRRERPSLPRAFLSLLGLLVLGAGILFSVHGVASRLSPLSVEEVWLLVLLSILVASLLAGVLAHRLAKTQDGVREFE